MTLQTIFLAVIIYLEGNPRGLPITPTYLLDWQAVRHSLGPKATPFCTLHVPIFVPKMDRDLLIHFREEQMPSVPQDKRKELQGRDTYTTQRYFFRIDVLVHMMEMNEYHKYTPLVYLKIIHSSTDLF